MVEPLRPVATVILVGVVTAEVASGLVVVQVKLVVQLVPPRGIVQFVAVSVPDITVEVTHVPEVVFQTVPAVQLASAVTPEPEGELGTKDLALL